jgi:hypothetical protein
VLGEIGAERFTDVGGGLFSTTRPHQIWLGYVGARLGVSETFWRGQHFELGAWMFARKDLDQATAINTGNGFFGGEGTTTNYQVGGYTAGAALRVGLRFDQRRAVPWSMEVASGP